MKELKNRNYLPFYRSKFSLLSLMLSVVIIVYALSWAIGKDNLDFYYDLRSIYIVIGGTFGCLLFQFDLSSIVKTLSIILRSFYEPPEKLLTPIIMELDNCIIDNERIIELREADVLKGELINDVIYMTKKGLIIEEVEGFIASRVQSDLLQRKLAVSFLERGAKLAPALGLLGTVIGLIEVLQQLDEPSNIGPAMSLALMTTAFGAILGSLFFSPLAGRLSTHSVVYLELNNLFMKRVTILLKREEIMMDNANINRQIGD